MEFETNEKSTGKYKPEDGICDKCINCHIIKYEIAPNTTGNYIRYSFYCTLKREYLTDRIIECNKSNILL